ncbi:MULTISPECIES: ion transporter [Methanosarcina]|uniref:Potassium voltage-gated channel subfamily KQT n=1 Tax=Methanosarcina vacuolata Z-761 TaxID=1434123 RepID=A0A0E3Q823_9EURY|nr:MULTISPECIES: ion transporter [Methanosarcina]AKB44798.1 Potassium voltage-gated channel subfamily KQT [Methanosarcina vacuolata Z-761]AKB48315.1 Potassium voltage-gated channel subfamily KQT [Methanosarcina sp. Kolksee]
MDKEQLKEERMELLSQIDSLFDFPLTSLSILWLILIIIDLVSGLSSTLQTLSFFIWGIFIIDFFVELVVSPKMKDYLKENWLVALSLFLPALRILRLFSGLKMVRFASHVRSLHLASVLSSFYRSLRTARQIIEQRGLGYILLLTTLITLLGAAGMYDFERQGFTSYPDALWWTAMIMITAGSNYWPKTIEGKILAFLLSAYAFYIFVYVTAALASLLVGSEKSFSKEIEELRSKVQRLSSKINRFSEREKSRFAKVLNLFCYWFLSIFRIPELLFIRQKPIKFADYCIA